MIIYTAPTIIAPATASGVGAIAVIRLSGGSAIEIANKHFRGKNLLKVPSHTIHFGTIRDSEGGIIDEVLMSVFRAPSSYTREDTVEISCHGSPYIVQKIMELYLSAGAEMAQAGEFTQRAFLNGQLDLSQAEAVADLIASESAAQHRLAIQQMRGGFSTQIKQLRLQLIHFASMLELELDFGEEDVAFADRNELLQLIDRITLVLQGLLRSFDLGNVLKNGVATAIIGKPNAGKSTLLNALLNDDRAIVSEIAGTTRDTIEELFVMEGVQFRLIDTAGIRATEDTIEAIGVSKAYQKAAQAQIILYLFDATTSPIQEIIDDVESLLRPDVSILLCANKIDLLAEKEKEAILLALKPFISTHALDFIGISALEKINLSVLQLSLLEAVYRRGGGENDVVVTNARHAAALRSALESLHTARENLLHDVASDFVALDVRHAIHSLGLLTGEVSTDDLLEKIFRDFCIGK